MTGGPVFETAARGSRTAAFVVAGAEKREIRGLPSPRLAAVGKMRLFADTAAAGRSQLLK
jgi:hypothetical protein